ncbi:MAG: hypothetical protein GX809_06085, partial [Clostridiaceae bacterium]|nr:hypothetical protein [Clostridiaceae bacterium]
MTRGLKFVEGSLGGGTNSTHLSAEPIELYDGNTHLGTLIKVSDLDNTKVNEFKFKTEVVDPVILAGNDPSNTRVYNTATLHHGLNRLSSDRASTKFNNRILQKEMLKREEVGNDHDGESIKPNNKTTTTNKGFHYGHKEVIFRLNINGSGLDFAGVDTTLDNGFGKVTIVDTLPVGWVFTAFKNESKYLIYKTTGTSEGSLEADGSPISVSAVSGDLEVTFSPGTDTQGETATFVFSGLAEPYVILVKAGPTGETLDNYLLESSNSRDEKNTLTLTTENLEDWKKEAFQDVTIDSQTLHKTVDFSDAHLTGEATWTIDYKPLDRPIDIGLEARLPDGIDLRTDSMGDILWVSEGEQNIRVYELDMDEEGSGEFVLPVVKELELDIVKEHVEYDPDERLLTFYFPDNTRAYRLIYITDVTGTPGEINNQVKLINGLTDGAADNAGFEIEEKHGQATMSRSPYLVIKKMNSTGELNLKDAVFTLYNTDSEGNKSSARAVRTTDNTGKATFYGLVTGHYILVETTAPDDYQENQLEYDVYVDESTVTVGGHIVLEDGEGEPLIIKNYLEEEEVGNLSLMKTVLGNDGDTDKEFNFQFTFMDGVEVIADSFDYIGENGASGGTVASGEGITLKHGQKITVIGIPAGTDYLITEVEANEGGYVTTSDYHEGTIVDDEIATATFINTRNVGSLYLEKKVEGNDGDFEREFEFLLELFRPDGEVDETEYGYTINDDYSDSIQGSATIMLSHGDIFFIEKLPVNTGYRVTEVDANTDGYVADETVLEGFIETGLTSQLLFTNTRDVGHLRIEKKLAGNFVEKDRKFAFTVQLYMPGEEELDETPYAYTINGLHAGEIVGEGSFELGDGD